MSPGQLLKNAALVFLVLAFAATASAASIRLFNQDARSYALYVKHQGSAVHTSIGPRTVTNICSKACTITLSDTGASITAKPGQQIRIKNGRLTRR